jgi:hypothetical protein
MVELNRWNNNNQQHTKGQVSRKPGQVHYCFGDASTVRIAAARRLLRHLRGRKLASVSGDSLATEGMASVPRDRRRGRHGRSEWSPCPRWTCPPEWGEVSLPVR